MFGRAQREIKRGRDRHKSVWPIAPGQPEARVEDGEGSWAYRGESLPYAVASNGKGNLARTTCHALVKRVTLR